MCAIEERLLWIEKAAFGAGVCPGMVLGVLALNAFADVSGPAAQPGVVKYREYSDSDPRTMFFLRSFIVVAWNDGGREEEVSKIGACYNNLNVGDNVTVIERRGALGISRGGGSGGGGGGLGGGGRGGGNE